jgi:hypothetical protein
MEEGMPSHLVDAFSATHAGQRRRRDAMLCSSEADHAASRSDFPTEVRDLGLAAPDF